MAGQRRRFLLEDLLVGQRQHSVLPVTGQYVDVDGRSVDERTLAKPLVGVYINGEVEHVDGVPEQTIRDSWIVDASRLAGAQGN